MNEKRDRGSHTTAQGVLIDAPGLAGDGVETALIDTPGIRRFVPCVSEDALLLHLREFAPLAGKCAFGLSCSHETEPGCKVLEAVAAGVIHEDRYESFLRIREELRGLGN
jgi:ribosome biogenesis GTPase